MQKQNLIEASGIRLNGMDLDGMIKRLEDSLKAEEIAHQKAISEPDYSEKLIAEIKSEIDHYSVLLKATKKRQTRNMLRWRLFTDLIEYEKLLAEAKINFSVKEYAKLKGV